jgi:hypothetical protein
LHQTKKIVMMMMRKGSIIFYSQAAPAAAAADYDFLHHSNPQKTCNPQQTWIG